MRTFTTLALAGATTTLASPAPAQFVCAERDAMVRQLAQEHDESFAGGGMQDSERIFEVWASTESGTWTILLTRADGTACIMASGIAWRDTLPEDQRLSGIPG